MTERAVEAMARELATAIWPRIPGESADMWEARIAAIIAKHLRPPAQPASEREVEIRDLLHVHTVSPHPADTPPEPWFSAVRDLLDMLDAERAAVAQARREARAAALEEAAKVCEAEAVTRRDRAENPWPGDSYLQPFSQDMVQHSKAITADGLARNIRALAKEPRMQDKPSDAEMEEACERAAISHNSLAETHGLWADAEKDDAALRARYLAAQKRDERLAQCFSAAAERIRAMGWRDISTANKEDRIWVEQRLEKYSPAIITARWSNMMGAWIDSARGKRLRDQPTRWRPVEEPPHEG